MDINLEHLDSDKFEDLCNNLLRREVGGVTSIDGSGGDNGVDGFKGEIEGEVVVYQHKFYPGRLSKSSRKRSIIKSFKTAQEHHPEMEKWVLLIATDFTIGEQEWFEQEIAQSAPDIETGYWNKTEIEDRVSQNETLVHRFFPTSMMSLGQRQRELLNYLDASVVGRTSMLHERLDEMKEEYPDLGIEYEFSSKDDKHRLTINPEFDVSVQTNLKVDEEKVERIQQQKQVRFNKDEIGSVEFNPELLPDEELEPDELVMKPWYSDWEEDVQVEVPGGGFKKELTIHVEDVSDDVITIGTKDPVFDLSIQYDATSEKTDFDITPELENEPIHRVSELLDFVYKLKSNDRVLIRRLEDGKSVFSGESITDEDFEGIEWFRDIITKLELIEAHTGTSLSLEKEIDENEELEIIIAEKLLTEGESTCPYTLNGEIMEGMREELLDTYDEDEPTRMKAILDGFYVTVQDQEISIGDVEFIYPNPELVNIEEIRADIGSEDPTEFEIEPSEDSIIKVK